MEGGGFYYFDFKLKKYNNIVIFVFFICDKDYFSYLRFWCELGGVILCRRIISLAIRILGLLFISYGVLGE